MNQTIEDLKSRRSIRKFKDEQISDEDLNTILETGTYAPTGRGAQSPKIIVIQNPDTIKEFSQWNRSFFPTEVPMIWIHSTVQRHCSLSWPIVNFQHMLRMDPAYCVY